MVTSTTDALSTAGVERDHAGRRQPTASSPRPRPPRSGAQFTPAGLDSYRAVVFLNTGMASPLNDAQRTNFEAYFKKGGGFVGIGSAVETDPSWSFLTSILGTRSSGQTGSQTGTVKVFDRVHDATQEPAGVLGPHRDLGTTSRPTSAASSHVLATVVEDPFEPQPAGNTLDGIAGGTMGANHPISFCKDFQGGRSFYTGLGTSAAAFDASLQTHLKGAIAWAAGQSNAATSATAARPC